MTDASTDQVTALVILRAAVAGSFHSGAPIESSNLASAMPAERDVQRVTDEFRRLGFDVGPMVGISMSITAPRAQFEAAFDVVLDHHDDCWSVHVADAESDDGASSASVPLDALDAAVADRVEQVVFEPPRELDEGPTWH